MHLGNVFTALVSWLSVKSRGGRWVLRIEDLDPQRSRVEYARLIEDDLAWLGLEWDEGGVDGKGDFGPYYQSARHHLYEEALGRIKSTGLAYACTCTRADIMATQAPHRSDGRVIYPGTCRPALMPAPFAAPERPHAVRLHVPDREVRFTDRVFGPQTVNLACACGDFVLRRADGAWAYQLAVVVDDALMGITEVVRGCDLLESSAQQEYIYGLLGLRAPSWAHLPLICNASGQRLSKRDSSLCLEALRPKYSPRQIIGGLAFICGLIPEYTPLSATDLLSLFNWDKFGARSQISIDC